MLGKLIKHEWLSTWKVPTALFIYLSIFTLMGCLSFMTPVFESENPIIGMLFVLCLILYILSIFAVSITIMVYFVVRFYRNMYSNEGYLTHTLPAKPWQHIFAKGLIYFIWMIINAFAITFFIALLAVSAISSIEGMSLYAMWNTFQNEVLPQINPLMNELMGISLGGYIAIMAVSALLSGICSILTIYASISIGQLFSRHKVMASFIAYAAINSVMQIIASLLQLPIYSLSEDTYSFYEVFSPIIWGAMVLSVVLIIVFYLITEYITRKKLNLD